MRNTSMACTRTEGAFVLRRERPQGPEGHDAGQAGEANEDVVERLRMRGSSPNASRSSIGYEGTSDG